MKLLNRFVSAAALAAFFIASAQAQNSGTVTNHAFAIGKGPGVTGYTSLLCGSAQLAVGQAAADPICRTITGDVTIDAAGVTAIGANKVTNSQLALQTAKTFKCNTSVSSASPQDCTAAQAGQIPSPPMVLRFAGTRTTFTSDATATLIRVWLQGAGGGGSGNGNTNNIPYTQYGYIGEPSAFGEDTFTVTINNTGGASAATITGTAINATCNQPFYLTTTGTLPSPFAANTLYYTGCPPDLTLTANTLQASPIQWPIPLTCAVSPTRCQATNTINTTTAGSGTHTLHLYHYVAQGGNGGGIVGDQAVPGSYVNCDGFGPAGIVQSVGLQGSVGHNQYGMNIAGGAGGGSPFGGAGGGGEGGVNGTGAGGGGANPTLTSSAGGGGASGGWCYITLRNNGATAYPMMCGLGGALGPAYTATVTVTIASPGVFTLNSHGMGPNAAFTLTTTGALPTGLTAGTTYYVNPETITANTFRVSASPYGAVINTSGSQSGTHTLHSGNVGGVGGNGQCLIEQLYGVN